MKYPFLERIRDLYARLLFPQTCIVCGAFSESACPLCACCMEKRFIQITRSLSFSTADPDRCAKCGRPLISARELCTACRALPLFSAIDRIITLFPYTGAGTELLAAWKINGMRSLSRPFAQLLSAVLECSSIPLVPVPPRPGKIREKGWDQIEELARILERSHGKTVLRCLRRTGGVQQKKLGKAGRSGNLKGYIEIIAGMVLPETVIIIDDLMTTGSTLDACAGILKSAGCRKVYGLTLFFD